MPKSTVTSKTTTTQSTDALLNRLKGFLPTLSMLELPTSKQLTSYIPGFVAFPLGIKNHSVLISSLERQYACVVKFANTIFGAANQYFTVAQDNRKIYVGDFIAKSQAEKADQVVADSVKKFMTAQSEALAGFKTELKAAAEKPLAEEDDSSSSYASDASDDEADSEEYIITEEMKKYCAATVQALAGLKTLLIQAKRFQEATNDYHKDPKTMRSKLDTAYHQCKETAAETALLLNALHDSYVYDNLPDLALVAKEVRNASDALLNNVPSGYHPSESVKVDVSKRLR